MAWKAMVIKLELIESPKLPRMGGFLTDSGGGGRGGILNGGRRDVCFDAFYAFIRISFIHN